MIYASQNLGRNVVTKLPHMIGKSIPAWTGWSLLALCFLTYIYVKTFNFKDRGFESHLRLALWVLLQESPDALNMAGPDCAPWGLPARSTTGRSVLNILGRQDLPFVCGGNIMVARLLGMNQNEIPQLTMFMANIWTIFHIRLVAFCLVCLSRHLIFVVENPSASLLPQNPRWSWFQNVICWETWL